MHYKHLPARKSRVKQEALQKYCLGGEVCLHVWLSLWTLNLRVAIGNTNKRRHPADLVALHNIALTSKEGGSRLLKAPCHFEGHMFPIENGLHPSRHISVSLWFKPETKKGLHLSHLYVPASKKLHPEMICTGRNSCTFLSDRYLHSFLKGLWTVILHFIVTNGPWKVDMLGGARLGMSGGMLVWVFIFIPNSLKPVHF